MSCYADGVLIADDATFPMPWLGAEPMTELIRSTMTPIDLPQGAGVHAFRWTTDGSAPAPTACDSLPATGDRAGGGPSRG